MPQAAREAGVSVATVHQARRVLRDAVPEVIQGVRDARLTIHEAERLRRMPKAEQVAVAQHAVAAPKRSPVRRPLGIPGSKRSPIRSPEQQIEAMAEEAGRVVRFIHTVTASHRDVHVSAACLKGLRKTRQRIATVIHRLEGNAHE